MSENRQETHRSWVAKFRDAFRGIALGMGGERSFAVHLPVAALVVIGGFVLRVSPVQWGLLVLCISAVLAAELFNSALERIAPVIDRDHNPQLGAALDIASGAVLMASIGAAVVGGTIFIQRLAQMWAA